jgi:hypothetical protein
MACSMATPRTGRLRGRPAGKRGKDFFEDLQRYPRALADAFQGCGLSERAAIDLANGWSRGRECRPDKMPRNIRQAPADNILIGHELPQTLSFKGANATLRQFGLRFGNLPDPPGTNRITPFVWRRNMAKAFGIAFAPNKEAGPHSLEAAILDLADAVDENEFAKCVIIPMLRQKF